MAGRKAFDIILQGGGQVLLVFKGDPDPDEVGAFSQQVEKHLASGRPVTMLVGADKIIDNRPMNEQSPTRIITRDRSSERIHFRYIEVQENGAERTLVDERCQTDQSGKFDVLTEVPESADRNTLCRWCFPGSENLNG